MGAKLCGAITIIAVNRRQSRLDLALELGATHTVSRLDSDPVEVIEEITAGRGVQFYPIRPVTPFMAMRSGGCSMAVIQCLLPGRMLTQ